MFVLGVGLFIIGKLLHRKTQREHEYFPFLMTGFEAGMLGISLFGTAYGLDRVGFLAVVDLGQELFIWFVFLALMLVKRDGISSASSLAAAFFRSPVIIGILLRLGGNLIGIRDRLHEWAVTGGVLNTLDFFGALTVPLILLIVGYGIRIDMQGVREAAVPVVTRFMIILPLAVALPPLLIGNLLGGNEYSQAALFTLLILPPPFIIPLYMKDGLTERRYVNNVLSLYTLVSIIASIVYLSVNPLWAAVHLQDWPNGLSYQTY